MVMDNACKGMCVHMDCRVVRVLYLLNFIEYSKVPLQNAVMSSMGQFPAFGMHKWDVALCFAGMNAVPSDP